MKPRSVESNENIELHKKIQALIHKKEDEIESETFKKDSSKALADLDDKINQTAKHINNDSACNMIEEVKNISDFIFKTLNELATKDITVNITQLKINLIIQLSIFTNYDLEEASILANKVVIDLTSHYMKNEKISYEKLTKEIEKLIDPDLKENIFLDLLQAIKTPCLDYIHHKEKFYTDLYNEKENKFLKYLSSKNQILVKKEEEHQKQARIDAKTNMLNYLIQSKCPKDFNIEIIKLGMEELEVKRRAIEQNDVRLLLEFKQYQLNVLQQSGAELKTILLKYASEHEQSYSAIKTLIPEVQELYMQIASDYIPQKTHSHPDISDAFLSPTKKINQKVLARLESYQEHIRNQNYQQFKVKIQFEKNIEILIQLKNKTGLDPSRKSYLEIINRQLQQLSFQFQPRTMFAPKSLITETTPRCLQQPILPDKKAFGRKDN